MEGKIVLGTCWQTQSSKLLTCAMYLNLPNLSLLKYLGHNKIESLHLNME